MIANCRWLRGDCRTSDHHQDNHLAHRETNRHDPFRLGLVFGVRPQTPQGYHDNLGRLPLNEESKVDGNRIDIPSYQRSGL
tara:strand:+ start:648 stop:890 length:243 start_codon:yes stop_codon:yes gene_type:complete